MEKLDLVWTLHSTCKVLTVRWHVQTTACGPTMLHAGSTPCRQHPQENTGHPSAQDSPSGPSRSCTQESRAPTASRASLLGLRWSLTGCLICIFLTTDGTCYLSVCLLAICTSSFVTCGFIFFASVLWGCLSVSYWFEDIPYICWKWVFCRSTSQIRFSIPWGSIFHSLHAVFLIKENSLFQSRKASFSSCMMGSVYPG